MALGAAAGAGIRGPAAPATEPTLTFLGPVAIHLPEDVGDWSIVDAEAFEPIRSSQALGGARIEGAWGAVAPGGVVVTVLTAHLRLEGSGPDVLAALPNAGSATWTGREDHVASSQMVNGVRELVLVVLRGDLLTILGVSGPDSTFSSGALEEAFRTAEVTS